MMSLISLTWTVSSVMAGGTGRRGGGGRGRWHKVYFSIPIPFCLLLPNVPLCLFKLSFVNLLGVSPLVETTHVGWSSSPAIQFVLQWLDHLHSSSYFDHILRIQTMQLCTVEYVSSTHPLFMPQFLDRVKECIKGPYHKSLEQQH